MNPIVGFLINNMNQKIKKYNIWDIKLSQGAAVFMALIIVKLYPSIISISIWWFVLFLILCTIKPLISFLKGGSSNI